MPQIFVFTAGNPEARQHIVDSVENSSPTRSCSATSTSPTVRSWTLRA